MSEPIMQQGRSEMKTTVTSFIGRDLRRRTSVQVERQRIKRSEPYVGVNWELVTVEAEHEDASYLQMCPLTGLHSKGRHDVHGCITALSSEVFLRTMMLGTILVSRLILDSRSI